jgi:hypothetical protein
MKVTKKVKIHLFKCLFFGLDKPVPVFDLLFRKLFQIVS